MKVAAQWITALLAVAACTQCSGHPHGKMCPPAFGKMPFDAQQLQGQWYVISVSPNAPNTQHKLNGNITEKCIKSTFKTKTVGDENRYTIDTRITQQSGSEVDYSLNCVADGPPGKPGSAGQCVITVEKLTLGSLSQNVVLATDYKTFQVTQSCGVYYDPTADSFTRYINLAILGRKPTMPADQLRLLKAVFSNGEITPDSFIDMDNSGC